MSNELSTQFEQSVAKFEANNIFVIADKVTSNLFNSTEIDEEGITYSIGYDRILATAALEADDANQKLFTVIKSLSDFDKAVLDSVCSYFKVLQKKAELSKIELIKRKEEQLKRSLTPAELLRISSLAEDSLVFSAKNIFATLAAESKVENFSKQSISDIESSIDNMSRIQVEISMFDPESKKNITVQTRLLPVIKVTKEYSYGYVANDQKSNAIGSFKFYKITEEPALLSYSTKMNLVSVVPINKLKTNIVKTRRNIALITYLETKIVDEKISLIEFEDIYKRLGLKASNAKKRTRDSVFQILNCWKDNGLILSWAIHEVAKTSFKTPLSITIDNNNEYSYETFLKSMESGPAIEEQKQ